jgi:hypothetical protein
MHCKFSQIEFPRESWPVIMAEFIRPNRHLAELTIGSLISIINVVLILISRLPLPLNKDGNKNNKVDNIKKLNANSLQKLYGTLILLAIF